MQILGCKGIPIARIQLVVAHIGIPEKNGIVAITDHVGGKETTIWVPKSVIKHFSVGDVIQALCVMSADLKYGWETFALAIKREGIIEQVYKKSEMWQNEFSSLSF